MNATVISFDLKSDFGFFRKPDTNEGVQLSYNMLHKPALLGILGAILGLSGYQKKGKWPEYYEKLKNLRVGISPLENWHERGNFKRTVLTYTNGVGYANADGNLIVTENILIAAAYQVYLLLDDENSLHQQLKERIQAGESVFIPYFGKNEMFVWWEPSSVKSFFVEEFQPENSFQIDSLFMKSSPVARQQAGQDLFFLDNLGSSDFLYFEQLPVGFDEQLRQYKLADFAFSNCKWTIEVPIPNLFRVKNTNQQRIIQLF